MYYKHSRYDGHISLAIKIKKMGKEFNLNIGASEDAGKGKGSSGFSFKHTMNMKKAFKGGAEGTDVMSDGYYNTVNESGSGINMNVPGPQYGSPTQKLGPTLLDEGTMEENLNEHGDEGGATTPPGYDESGDSPTPYVKIDLEKAKQAGQLNKAFTNIEKNIKSDSRKIQDKDKVNSPSGTRGGKTTWQTKSQIYRGRGEGARKRSGDVSHEQARAYQTYKDNAEKNKRRVGEGNVY